jgi:xylulokinase
MLSAAGSAAWLRAVLAADLADLEAEAAQWPPGSEGLLFAPYLGGERTPHSDPDARGAFVGLSVRHDRGTLWRALLEGVAYGLRDSLELLRELGARPASGRVSGGGARSELWLRILASVLGLSLETTESEEGSRTPTTQLFAASGCGAGSSRIGTTTMATGAFAASTRPSDPWRSRDDRPGVTASAVSSRRMSSRPRASRPRVP